MKNDIREILKGLGYNTPDAKVYSAINLWLSWYKGYCSKFHDYRQYNGKNFVKRRRKSLRMAKKVCEDHADLLLNEKVQLTITPNTAQEKIDAALLANDFRVQANKLVEKAFALGTGAFVEHTDGKGGVLIDYVRADMIFPLSWDGEEITECAFASIKMIEGVQYIYLNIHELDGAQYIIKNVLVPVEGGVTKADGQLKINSKPVDAETKLLPGDLVAELPTGSLTPRFQLIGPNKVNTEDLDSPMGASVFSDSIDVLEGVDLVYDSYLNEFRLGKKRIIVSLDLLQVVQDGDSTFMAFDDNDTEFYGLKSTGSEDDKEKIHEINMDLRAEPHELGLQRNLNLLSDKCGLGNDRYSFERGQLKTATEVISDKSDLFGTLQKNELVLRAALQNMCKAIAEICGIKTAITVEVGFDDSIIEDTAAKRTRMQLLVTQGRFPLWRYLMEYEGYDEKTAREIEAETKAAEQAIDFTNDPGV